MTERRADEATRDVNNWLKCYYMRDRIGEEFDGTIAAVVPFGVFVALDSVYVEGLLHVSELGEDYFQYDNVKHQMLGERSGKRYRLGDRLRVKLVRADLETGRVDFVLGETPSPKAQPADAKAEKKSAFKKMVDAAAKAISGVTEKGRAKRAAEKTAKAPVKDDRAAGKAAKPAAKAAPAKAAGGKRGVGKAEKEAKAPAKRPRKRS